MDKGINQYHFKQQIIFICCLLFYIVSIAQVKNLLRNPSLDSLTIDSCNINYPSTSLHWDQNSFNDPLAYNSCFNDTIFSTPKNKEGFQFTKSGTGYSIFDPISNNYGTNTRLYLQSKLIRKLKSKRHYIYIYISLVDISVVATSRIQLALTQNKLVNPICCQQLISLPPAFTPQIQNPLGNIISDTLNWTKIEGSFKANGNEEYITIGNFFTDSNTDTMRLTNSLNPIFVNCGYYVDDMHLVEEDRAVAYFDTTLESPLCVNLGDSVVLGDTLVRPWLQYEWKDAFGNILCTTRNCAYYGNSIGTSYATVSITDTAADAYITKAIDTVFITTSLNCPTSIKTLIQQSQNIRFKLSEQTFYLYNLPPSLKTGTIKIMNLQGQVVYENKLQEQGILPTALSKGFYYVDIRSNDLSIKKEKVVME
jgi:hypothetical protein